MHHAQQWVEDWQHSAGWWVSRREVTDEIRVGEVNKQVVSYSNIGETLQELVCSIVRWELPLPAKSKTHWRVTWSLLHTSHLLCCSTSSEQHMKWNILSAALALPWESVCIYSVNLANLASYSLLGNLFWISHFGGRHCGSYIFFSP